MTRIRVLVLASPGALSRLVADVLASDNGIEVVEIAASGAGAIARIVGFNPDLVTIELDTSNAYGLQTLRCLRTAFRRLPVITFSSATVEGTAATIEALAAGATDYVTLPANVSSLGGTEQCVRDLLTKAKALAVANFSAGWRPLATCGSLGLQPSRRAASRCVDVVVIGSSTGGPNALAMIVEHLPANLPVPVLVAQHMPPVFTVMLAEHLSNRCRLPVREAHDGDLVEAGRLWIAPGDYHLAIRRSGSRVHLRTHQEPLENSCRPAVDVLFRSAAECYGAAVLAVVLTGMGYDGLRGSECVRNAGGEVIVQDEASSVAWGMAGAVAKAGLADWIWPLHQIGPAILERVLAPRCPPVCRTGDVDHAGA